MMSNEAKHPIEHSELEEERMVATLNEQPSSSGDAFLPSSVKGAPEELKPAIRKKQNKEVKLTSRKFVENSTHSLNQHEWAKYKLLSHLSQYTNNFGLFPMFLFRSQSARRSRQRKNEMIGQMATAIMSMVNRMNAMENRINKMEGYLRSQGIITDSSASLNQAPVQTAPPSIQPNPNNLPITANRSDDSLAQDLSSRTNSSNADDQIEDDVNNLIQRCLEQFE